MSFDHSAAAHVFDRTVHDVHLEPPNYCQAACSFNTVSAHRTFPLAFTQASTWFASDLSSQAFVHEVRDTVCTSLKLVLQTLPINSDPLATVLISRHPSTSVDQHILVLMCFMSSPGVVISMNLSEPSF